MARFCPNCGARTKLWDTFCGNCGISLSGSASNHTANIITVAAAVTFGISVLGIAGVFLLPSLMQGRETLPPETSSEAAAETAVSTELSVDEKSPEATETDIVTEPSVNETIFEAESLSETTAAETEAIPDIEKYHLIENLSVGELCEFRTVCTKESALETTGTILILDYQREDADENIIAFGQENGLDLNDYEKLSVSVSIVFDDENAKAYAASFRNQYFDVTDRNRFDDSEITLTDSYGEEYQRGEITYNGGNAYIYRWDDFNYDWSEGEPVYFTEDWTFLVPKGYTGMMIGYRHGAIEHTGEHFENYSPENYYLFRLD